jgi:hypothetical protein
MELMAINARITIEIASEQSEKTFNKYTLVSAIVNGSRVKAS